MKKTVLLAALALFGAIAFAQSPPPEFFYDIIDGRTVTITKYTGNAITLTIPDYINNLPVTSIGEEAFAIRIYLTGTTAFFQVEYICDLTSITIPYSVTSIEDGAFIGCNNLTSINVDNSNSSYASIDGVLFDKNIRTLIKYPQAKNFRTYVIPSTVTSIGDEAFYGCRNLNNVTMPSSLTSIGEGAFSFSSLTSVNIPSSVKSIGDGAFQFCENLSSITIPSSVTSIGNGAFMACPNLENIIIPSSVIFIGGHAFYDCRSLTSITIPSSVTFIGEYAFYDCRRLTSITLSLRTQVGERAFPDSTRIIYSD